MARKGAMKWSSHSVFATPKHLAFRLPQKKSTDHTENTEISLKAIVQIEKEAVFTYGLFYNKININHCTIDFINNYNYLRCKYTNNNDMFQIFWGFFFIMSHDRSMTPSPSVTVDSLTVSKNVFAFQITDNR